VPAAALIFAMSVAASFPACAQQPPWEGCRQVSKIEYESAKENFLLRTRTRVYLRTGSFWRRYYWQCHI
jgi:hypothetical protein